MGHTGDTTYVSTGGCVWTRKDIEDMEAEIEHRKIVVRKELLEHVKEARAQGDLSENFEYYAAKKAKNQNESRIRFLERMIKTAKVIDDNTTEDEVGMNKLMWGSDYPRTITAITYRMSYDFILKTTELTDESKALFLGQNAVGFYGIDTEIDLPYIKNMSE